MALSNKEGVQVDFLRLLSWMPHETVQNYESIITRLGQLGKQISQIIVLLKVGVNETIVLHERSAVGAMRAITLLS